jgi:hypothetical protein
MGPWRLGPLALGAAAHKAAAALAALVLGGGLWLGATSAADPAGHPAAIPAVESGAQPTAPPGARAAAPRRPALQGLAARLRGQQAQGHVLVGRFVDVERDTTGVTALVTTGPAQLRRVRITAQTRLPARLPRRGEAIVILGQPGPNGSYVARAVLLRPGARAGAAAARLVQQRK